MTIHGWKELTWKDDNLIFQGKKMVTLIPHKEIPKHWHLKFSWRDEPTPEFFNIYNARENARSISLAKVNNNVKKPTPEPRTAV